jgi:hypothetical protein
MYWIVCLAAANGAWIVIFKSPLVKHLLSLSCDEELITSVDVENFFLTRDLWFLHNLWVCATCQAVWTSAFATIMLFLFTSVGLLWMPVVLLATLPFAKWTQKHL